MAIKAGSTLGNILWFVFGGALMAIGYFLAGILSCLTIIGIGNGIQSFKLASFAWWPFGKRVVEKPGGTGCLGTLGNIIWFILCGWWLALSHIFWGIIFYLLIVTIPFGNRHFEMVGLSLLPYGKRIVDE